MRQYLIGIFVSAILIFLLGYLNVGAQIENFFSAILVAFVLSVLNVMVRPILTIISIPITVVTLGLFLLVINAVIILLAGEVVSGFVVHGFWGGMMFSVCLSLAQTLVLALSKKKKLVIRNIPPAPHSKGEWVVTSFNGWL